MPSFPKPSFTFDYDLDAERAALRRWRDTKPGRAIPDKTANSLLLATWNIANLGAQDRGPKDYALLAEVISWFDIVAIQEVKDDRKGLDGIVAQLSSSWRTLYSDAAGNDAGQGERLEDQDFDHRSYPSGCFRLLEQSLG